MHSRRILSRVLCLTLCLLTLYAVAGTKPVLIDGSCTSLNGSSLPSRLSEWFYEHYPHIPVEAEPTPHGGSAEDFLARLQSDAPPDIIGIDSSRCSLSRLRDSGLLEDLRSNGDLLQVLDSLYEPVQRLLSAPDGSMVFCPEQAFAFPHFWVPEAWQAAGLAEADVPQSVTELMDFAEDWIQLYKHGKTGNVRLNVLGSGTGYALSDERYTLWLLDLLRDSWVWQAQRAGKAYAFNTPEFTALAVRAREIGRALNKAEKRPSAKSLPV